MAKLLIEIDHGKIITNRIRELEGIIKILEINEPIKRVIQDKIEDIKNAFKEGKLKEGEG